MPKIVVHHLETSRSHRVLWLLAELGLEYELVMHRRDPETIRAPAELRKLHPLGKAPVVQIDDLVLAESGAILEYFVERFEDKNLRPAANSDALVQYRYWMHYAEGSLMPPLLVKLIFERIRVAPLPFFIKPVARLIVKRVDEAYTQRELALHFDFIEKRLSEQPWFAGDSFSAADVQMSYPIEAGIDGGRGPTRELPSTRAWLKKIMGREAYKQALERGGPVVHKP